MLNEKEDKELLKCKEPYYMKPIIKVLERHISEHGLTQSFSYLHKVLVEAKNEVDALLEKRKEDGHITSIPQARKSIAGSAFSNLFKLLFLLIKKENKIRDNIFISSKPKNNKHIDKII